MNPKQFLSRGAIDEFRKIYEEEFGELLSDDDVHESGLRLLRLFDILLDVGETESPAAKALV
jgi:hypothetical protein